MCTHGALKPASPERNSDGFWLRKRGQEPGSLAQLRWSSLPLGLAVKLSGLQRGNRPRKKPCSEQMEKGPEKPEIF